MNDSNMEQNISELRKAANASLGNEFAERELLRDERLYEFVRRLSGQFEMIYEIDPSLPEKEILLTLAKNIVLFLGAEFASIWISEPEREGMTSFGSFPLLVDDQEEAIPFEYAIAAEVLKTRRSHCVPNILKEEKYENKEKVTRLGIHSMLTIPILLPRFSIKEVDTEGILQVYYAEQDRMFTPLEIEIAEVLSSRVSYVIARKRIKELQKFHTIKDKIVEHLFMKLARREGVKMKDLFNGIIPELTDIMKIQRCSLFSVMEDQEAVLLEAGFPEVEHGIGKTYSLKEPYISIMVNETGPFGRFENEEVYPTYVHITNPKGSLLLSPDLKQFLERQQIHSVLYLPLKVDEGVKYFLAFDAQAHHEGFTAEQIDLFTFFGKELMKGLRLEKMGDVVHDFKNPAIAMAGFAKRLQKILEDGDYPSKKRKADDTLDIILKESLRIQELALTLHGEGKESIMDMSDVLRRRFLINEEYLKELKRSEVRLVEQEMEPQLWVRCFPLHIERVFDNLLNNASRALPENDGELSIRTYRKDCWAVAEITNTGELSEEERTRYLRGEGRGRGLHINMRLVKHMGGMMLAESSEGRTTFRITLPLAEP
jgi:signal transduction histidine kinase